MLKKIALALAVVVVAFCAFVATRPGMSHIERSLVVAGTPAVAFARLNTMKSFADWSPWNDLDPTMNKTFSGPDEGVGASYYWNGNDKVGEGKMTIIESRRGEAVVEKLEFLRPFASESKVTFSIKPIDNATSTVVWAMDGDNGFMQKAAGLFLDMDKMVGGDFERGLLKLNVLLAADSAAAAAAEAAAAAGLPAASRAGAVVPVDVNGAPVVVPVVTEPAAKP